jgi:hypothetical protein
MSLRLFLISLLGYTSYGIAIKEELRSQAAQHINNELSIPIPILSEETIRRNEFCVYRYVSTITSWSPNCLDYARTYTFQMGPNNSRKLPWQVHMH